jgi:hypothetical protein
MSIIPVFVDCFSVDTIIRTYEFGCPVNAAGVASQPSNEDLISEAKSNLTCEKLAKPPYDGIKFVVRR